MADLSNAVRPEARPDAPGYRPLSGLAVASLIVSGFGAVVLTVLGVAATLSSKPALYPTMLLLPIAGIVLALAARWQLRRAEGTRVGGRLAAAGLWLGIIFGGVYAAYFFATELALRQQARTAADQFFTYLREDQPEKAFRLTLAPGQQLTIPEDDREGIRRRFGATEMAAFERNDLVRTCRRWHDKMTLEPLGIRTPEVVPTGGYQVDLDYRMRTPEGQSLASLSVTGLDDPSSGARIWQVMLTRSGLRDTRSTRLGRLYQELRFEASNFLRAWERRLYNGEVDVKGLLKIKGQPPEGAQKDLLEAQLKAPMSLTLFPGNAMFPAAPAEVKAEGGVIRLIHTIDTRLPAIGDLTPATLTVAVGNPQLNTELIGLQGPDWEKQQVYDTPPEKGQLGRTPMDFKVLEINLQPDAARPGPRGGP
jgi:hypothetical protein